eukprot:scaffold100147_cov33-Phaeocystis_antarctica.AAC.1
MAIHLEVGEARGLGLGLEPGLGHGRRTWKSARHEGAPGSRRGTVPGRARGGRRPAWRRSSAAARSSTAPRAG